MNNGSTFHTTDNTVVNARAIEVPNSTVVANVWDEVTPTNETQHYYALSPDGQSIVRVRKTTFDPKLQHGHFDPIDGELPIEDSLQAGPNNELYIVQFVTQSLEVYRDALTALGAKVYNYIPRRSHIVRMTPAVKSQVEALPFVRAVVPFHPAYKVPDDLRAELAAQYSSDVARKYAILTFEYPDDVVNQIVASGGEAITANPANRTIKATMTLDVVRDLIAMDKVQFINEMGEPTSAMDIAREISGATYLANLQSPEVPFTGTGVRGEVMDDHFYSGHNAFHSWTNLCLPSAQGGGESEYTFHGTPVFGIIFGDGTGSPSGSDGTGVLPDGQGIFTSYLGLGSEGALCAEDRDVETSKLVGPVCCEQGATGCPYGAVFQNNSWSEATKKVDYESAAYIIDDTAFKYDLLICQSQGNESSRTSMEEAWAKNIVSVGGIRHYNFGPSCRDRHEFTELEGCPPLNSPGCVTPPLTCPEGGPSYGFAEDNRVKPDLIHFYDNILTTCSGASNCYLDGSSELQLPFSGTSAAAPITCGHAGLIFEMWASDQDDDGINMFGNALADPNCDPQSENCVFINRPHATTVKAMMINAAYRYPLDQAGLTRDHQGWGMVDVKKLFDERDKMFVIDQTYWLANFQDTLQFNVDVPQGQPELRVTLVYPDPPGTVSADQHTINDLSLKVSPPSGSPYWGNCGLYFDDWSSNGCTGENQVIPGDSETIVLNTVENVFLQNPAAGTWTIAVTADDIAEDTALTFLNGDRSECCNKSLEDCTISGPTNAVFSLVVSGVSNVYGSCCLPGGRGCSNTTADACAQFAGDFNIGSTCAGGPVSCPGIE